MTTEAGSEIKARQGLYWRNHRYRVRGGVNHASPFFRDFDIAQHGISGLQIGERRIEHGLVGRRIEHAHPLKGRDFIEGPMSRPEQRFEKGGAQFHLDVSAFVHVSRPEGPQVAKCVGCQLERGMTSEADGVAPVKSPPEAESWRANGRVGDVSRGLGAQDRGTNTELWQFEAMAAAKQ